MLQITALNYETTVISPDGIECIIHDIPNSIDGDVSYQVIGQVWSDYHDDNFPNGTPLIRTMDAYTFCEWFKIGRANYVQK